MHVGKRSLIVGAATSVAALAYFSLGWLEATFDIEAFGEHHMARLGLAGMPVAVVQVVAPALIFTLVAVVPAFGSGRRRPSAPRPRPLGPFAQGALVGALAAAALGGLAMALEGTPAGIFGSLEKLLSAAGWVANHLLFERCAAGVASKGSNTWDALALARVYSSAAVSWVSWGLLGLAVARLSAAGRKR